MSIQENLSFYAVLVLIYMLNPFVGILLTTFVCLRAEQRPKGLVFLLFVLLAFWLGAVNNYYKSLVQHDFAAGE